MKNKYILPTLMLSVFLGVVWFAPARAAVPTVQNPQNGSVGLEGTLPTAPPTTAATITTVTNNTTYNDLPITVSGLCTTDLLVKIYKNNVFAGSTICVNGSYTIKIDLFNGANEIVARVFDALDQAGPDSIAVNVNFVDNGYQGVTRVSVTSNYAKRGANPGTTLGWPLTISGVSGPYAVSIDWGDGKTDLISREFAGTFTPEHKYQAAGIYNVTVKVTDKNGDAAFLQVVSIVNGVPGTDANGNAIPGSVPNPLTTTGTVQVELVVWPFYILVPFIVSTFWLGKRHAVYVIRKKLLSGQQPFRG